MAGFHRRTLSCILYRKILPFAARGEPLPASSSDLTRPPILQIARLYRPLETDDISDADDASEDEGTSGTQLLPLYSHPSAPSKSKPAKVARLHDVWDEREDLFGVGDDSDEEDGAGTPRPQRESSQHVPLAPPKILITSS